MRMRMWLGAVAMSTGLALTSAAWGQQARQDFTLINKTGLELSQIHVSPSKAAVWDKDLLTKESLEDGQAFDVRFERAEKSCHWDLRVTYEDATEAVWNAIDLCTVARVTIMYDQASGATSATFD